MENAPHGYLVLSHLATAKEKLVDILPPPPEKVVRALQYGVPSFPSNPEIITFRYRGPDRRGKYDYEIPESEYSAEVRFDAKGNPVLEIGTNVPRRRKEDDTFDCLKALEISSLSIAEDDD